jgi:hypothetical protein
MPWIRLDDDHHDDPRILAVSLSAVGLLHVALGWSCRQLGDGWVPAVFLESRARRATDRILRELSARKLVTAEARDGVPGWRIAADLVALQPSREEVLRDRENARERQRRSRLSRSGHSVTHGGNAEPSRCDSAVTDPVVTPVSQDPGPSRPVPDRSTKSRAGAQRSPVSMTIAEAKSHLTAAVHELIESGDPYVDRLGQPNDSALLDELKVIAARDLRVKWNTSAELGRIVDSVIGTREKRSA